MKSTFTKKENTDSGLALLLLTILTGLFLHSNILFRISVAEIILLMAAPVLFYPFTIVWLNLSYLMGVIMSKIIHPVVYYLLVVPMGIFRKMTGKDSLKLKRFKKDENSEFIVRNHDYTKSDFVAPY